MVPMNSIATLVMLFGVLHLGEALVCWQDVRLQEACGPSYSQIKCAALEGLFDRNQRMAVMGCISKNLEGYCNTKIPHNSPVLMQIGRPMRAEFSPFLPASNFSVCCCETNGCNDKNFAGTCGQAKPSTTPMATTVKPRGNGDGSISKNCHFLILTALLLGIAALM